jgi:hypothetical protein
MGFLKIIKTLLGLEKEVKQLVETATIAPVKEVKQTPKKVGKPKAKKQITK